MKFTNGNRAAAFQSKTYLRNHFFTRTSREDSVVHGTNQFHLALLFLAVYLKYSFKSFTSRGSLEELNVSIDTRYEAISNDQIRGKINPFFRQQEMNPLMDNVEMMGCIYWKMVL